VIELTEAERTLIQGWKRSPDDFDCLPRIMQAQVFTEFLFERGATHVPLSDLQEMFDVAEMVSPRSGNPIRPSPSELSKHIQGLLKRGKLAGRFDGAVLSLPWVHVTQDWELEMDCGSSQKAQKVGASVLARFLRPFEVMSIESRQDHFHLKATVRLHNVAWPNALAEALNLAGQLSKRWQLEIKGRFGAIGSAQRVSHSSIRSASFSVVTLDRPDH
jgi:hypothetical protein